MIFMYTNMVWLKFFISSIDYTFSRIRAECCSHSIIMILLCTDEVQYFKWNQIRNHRVMSHYQFCLTRFENNWSSHVNHIRNVPRDIKNRTESGCANKTRFVEIIKLNVSSLWRFVHFKKKKFARINKDCTVDLMTTCWAWNITVLLKQQPDEDTPTYAKRNGFSTNILKYILMAVH